MAISIYSYLDYRSFLRDYTAELKLTRRFRVRDFAQQAGIKAPGYLKMVIDGQRNLTADTAEKFCRALGLTGRARSYFRALVSYNQGTDPDLKRQAFQDLTRLRPRTSTFQSTARENRYFSRPYYVCIREMVALKDFQEDPKWIARRCFPTISPAQAKEAIETLLELGLLKRDRRGRLQHTEDFLQTDDVQTQAAETYHFHEAVLDKARHALTQLPQDERNYYALTVPLPRALYQEIMQDYYAFRDRLLKKIAASSADFDEVYHINFQLFPATRKKERLP